MTTSMARIREGALAICLGLALAGSRPASAQPQPSAERASVGSPEAFAERRGPRLCRGNYRAYSTARCSRITVTLTFPGYCISLSIRLAMSFASW